MTCKVQYGEPTNMNKQAIRHLVKTVLISGLYYRSSNMFKNSFKNGKWNDKT